MDINGASAIVTGGASGIGAATARLLASKGAKVVIADLPKLEVRIGMPRINGQPVALKTLSVNYPKNSGPASPAIMSTELAEGGKEVICKLHNEILTREKWSFPLDSILKITSADRMTKEIYGAPEDEEEEGSRGHQGHQEDTRTREVEDTTGTRSQGRTEPQDTGVAEDGKWSKPEASEAPKEAEKPKATGGDKYDSAGSKECIFGMEYGVSSDVSPTPRECRKCVAFDKCFDGKPFDWSKVPADERI